MNQRECIYNHTQPGHWLLLFLAVGIVIAFVILLAAVRIFGPAWSQILPSVIALTMLLVACLLFPSLTVTIDHEYLRVRFGKGPIRKRFPLNRIKHCRPVRVPWHHGLGIHWTPRGWLFNVSGRDAVEIEMHSGKKYRIGTDEPDKLGKAINQIVSDSS